MLAASTAAGAREPSRRGETLASAMLVELSGPRLPIWVSLSLSLCAIRLAIDRWVDCEGYKWRRRRRREESQDLLLDRSLLLVPMPSSLLSRLTKVAHNFVLSDIVG